MASRYTVTVGLPGVMFDGEDGLLRNGKQFPRKVYKFPLTVDGKRVRIELDYTKFYSSRRHWWTRAFDAEEYVDALARTVSERYPQLEVRVTERRVRRYPKK